MINIISWVFLGLCALSVALTFFLRKSSLLSLRKITFSANLPLFALFICARLFLKLPDSLNILITSILSFICVSIAIILSGSRENVKKQRAYKILLFCTVTLWTRLYNSTFYIYKVMPVISIAAAAVYFAIIFITQFKLKDSTKEEKLTAAVFTIISSVLNFSSLVTLIYGRQLYSIMLFAGTTVAMITITNLCFIKKDKEADAETEKMNLLRTISISASQGMIALASLFMIL